jgi:hypothetical protein
LLLHDAAGAAEKGSVLEVAGAWDPAHNTPMGFVIWAIVILAGVIGVCGYSATRGWGGRGHGSFRWWQSKRRRGWWW